MKQIITFDNLVESNRNGIIGSTQKVRALCSEDELAHLKDVPRRAGGAAKIFLKRFGKK